MRNLFLMLVLAFIASACGGVAQYNDGTWSNCTYSKDGRIVKAPMQVGPVPMEWTEPDGTSVKCEPIPKAVGAE